MGRKAQLEERLARSEERERRLRAAAGGDRHAIETARDALLSQSPYNVDAVVRLLDERLADDPRPPSDEGPLHWLHVVDGDRLVWRLAAELVRLHDAEALRLGEPTWTAPRLDGDPPGHPDLGPIDLGPGVDRLPLIHCGDRTRHPAHVWTLQTISGDLLTLRSDGFDEERWCSGSSADGTAPYDPTREADYDPPLPGAADPLPLVKLNDRVRFQWGHAELTMRVSSIGWHERTGWTIGLDSIGETAGCPAEDSP